jgi:hypothetical protein
MLEKFVPVRESSAGGAAIVGRFSSDDVQQLRYLSSKILQYVTSQGMQLLSRLIYHRSLDGSSSYWRAAEAAE